MRRWLARVWPVMRLRTIMFALLLLVAALPGVAAITLRVYENALVRRTEAELIAQTSALAASATLGWPHDATAPQLPEPRTDPEDQAITTSIDLRASPVLPERPDVPYAGQPPDPGAAHMAAIMAPVIAETKRATLAAIVLLDRHGVALNGRDAGRSFAALPEVQAALAGHADTVLRHNGDYSPAFALEWLSRGTDIRLHHARPIFVGGQVAGVVLASRSPSALFRGMWEDRGKIAAGATVIFLILVAMTAVLNRTIVRPIEALSRATRALTLGRQVGAAIAVPKPTLRVTEIDGLIRDFATMATTIDRRSQYLRDFAAALTHEFKTPLAGLAGGIELLQDHGATMSDRERAGFLANMAADAKRLDKLISRLMDLAKADLRQASAGEICDLGAVLARLADGLATADFGVRYEVPSGGAWCAAESQAVETVLTSLIDNARQAGARFIDIGARAEGDVLRITLADDGPGVPPADAVRVFEPFFTSKRAQGGTGLGLAIARSLIEANRGSLLLVPSPSGACFALELPRA